MYSSRIWTSLNSDRLSVLKISAHYFIKLYTNRETWERPTFDGRDVNLILLVPTQLHSNRFVRI